ncbi:MAG: hypothetical protein JRG77_02005 [Deltaproteobacteria bacterium]|nr:hypothetical protein [Deltaproteobacteria bacterium]MBW2097584.1 hypothetical protein [Deltaproteobacteria bacterium]
MHKYSDIIESFPEEFQLPMLKLLDRLREETLDIVQKSDFEALRAAFSSLAEKVLELAEAQRRSEVRLERLEAAVEKLVEAQLRIEERLERLEGVVEELAEAQKRTEARIEELAEAQKRTEARIEELAEAQQKTEKILQGVLLEQKRFRKELGGISNTVGYTLENEAIKHLPGILQRDIGLKINVMDRRFIEYPDGKYDEINIYGEGVLDGEEVYVIGESKVQIGKRNLNAFERLLKRLSGYLRGRIIPVLVTHSVHPEVERFVKEKIEGLLIYKSFQLV